MSTMRLIPAALLLSIVAPSAAPAQSSAEDPYLWLEDVSSPRAMDWVNAHNARSVAVLEADRRYPTLYSEAIEIASAKDRIPAPAFVHGEIYNFWQDADHLMDDRRRR